MRARRDREFEEWVRQHRGTLLDSAMRLTAGDRHFAEDLVQATLVRLYRAWPRARAMHVLPYARRILLNQLIDDKRRPVNRREHVHAEIPDVAVTDGEDSTLDVELMQALRDLPAGMRAAVVLRHVEGLSVEETADAIGVLPATVRSQTARGLERLRDALDLPALAAAGATTPTEQENRS